MKKAVDSTLFGKRSEPHTIIIAKGEHIRHFTVRPWMAAFLGSAVAAIAVGYLLATTYLVLRDDLIGAAVSRQVRMQHAYEDRISALRAQVDRITSRQLLDQNLVETKVTELLLRQSKLYERHGRIDPLLRRAEEVKGEAGAAAAKPDERASLDDTVMPLLAYDEAETAALPFDLWKTREASAPPASAADRADRMFVALNQSLRAIEDQQFDRVAALADDAYQTAETITDTLSDAGLPVDIDTGKSGVGGPFVAVDSATRFDNKVRELDDALDLLDRVKKHAKALPIASPAPGRAISSSFGVRKDPLLGTPAMHSGMDFRAPMGAPIRATAAGVVVSAGWNGGYGKMVEIDHGGGYTTRFAHMSRIDVKEGDRIQVGDVVGRVGSTGRSTGPHLHYEVRRNGDAVDPVRFLRIGKKLSKVL